MNSDSPIVDEVRARAEAISRRYQHDLAKYAEHLRDIEAKCRDRVVDQPAVTKPRQSEENRSKPAA